MVAIVTKLLEHVSQLAEELTDRYGLRALLGSLRGHVSEAELESARHAHQYTLEHEGPSGPAPSYL